jgi:hypothetical protein
MGIKYVLPSSHSLISAMAETVRFWRWVLAQHNSSHNHLHRPPAAKETRLNQASTSIIPTPRTVEDESIAATSGDFLITTEDDADVFVAFNVGREQADAFGSGNVAAYRYFQNDDNGATPNGHGSGRPRKS